MSKLSEVSVLLNNINAIESLVIVNDLEVKGLLPHGDEVSVKCQNFKFDSGIHNCPINFTVLIKVNGDVASRWDMTFENDQKEFQQGWVRLIAKLQREQWKREDDVRDVASALWREFAQ